jgi:hypothetical protein
MQLAADNSCLLESTLCAPAGLILRAPRPWFACPQEFDAFLAALAPVLARLSDAFSTLVLVCEGSAGFQAQVGRRGAGCVRDCPPALVCQLPPTPPCTCWPSPAGPCATQVLNGTVRLLALGRRCGLHLQCHATASAAASAAVVAGVASAWLARWRAAAPGLQYAVAEAPTEEETFLTRWGCGADEGNG